MKKVTPGLARFFVCSKREKVTNGVGEVQQEVMCDGLETVKEFCYLGNRLNASRGCEAAETARTRVGWKKFGECGEILLGHSMSTHTLFGIFWLTISDFAKILHVCRFGQENVSH